LGHARVFDGLGVARAEIKCSKSWHRASLRVRISFMGTSTWWRRGLPGGRPASAKSPRRLLGYHRVLCVAALQNPFAILLPRRSFEGHIQCFRIPIPFPRPHFASVVWPCLAKAPSMSQLGRIDRTLQKSLKNLDCVIPVRPALASGEYEATATLLNYLSYI